MRHGERPEPQRVNESENGGVSANAQPERQRRYQCKNLTRRQNAESKSKIAKKQHISLTLEKPQR
jgi:hypothetical protein